MNIVLVFWSIFAQCWTGPASNTPGFQPLCVALDLDHDGDWDLQDYAKFSNSLYPSLMKPANCLVSDSVKDFAYCMTGPARTMYGDDPSLPFCWAFRPIDKTQLCKVFDVDGDWDVDLADYAIWQRNRK